MATLPSLREQADSKDIEDLRAHRDEVRAELAIIFRSPEFMASRRASEFLNHILEKAIEGDIDSLKERLLGIEIFHRPNDYDTSSDAIVRVTANDVRKRLTNFYKSHDTEPVLIRLPLGSYVPLVTFRPDRPKPDAVLLVPPPVLASDVTALPAPPGPSESAPLATPGAEPGLHVASVSALPQAKSVAGGRLSRTFWIRLGLVSVVLLAAVAGWYGGQARMRHTSPDAPYGFYAELLGPMGADPKETTRIALSDPHVLIYRGASLANPEPEDELERVPVPPELTARLNGSANDTQALFPYHYFQVDTVNYTGMGEAQAAFGLAEVFRSIHRSEQLTEARFLNWDAARQQHMVLLGAPHMSAFAQDTLSTASFSMEHDSIRNNRPRPGEPKEWVRRNHGSTLEDYGLIWMAKSPAGSRVLVLAGLTSTGTAGVGEFFSDPVRMRPVYEQLRALGRDGSVPQRWQVLLRVDAHENVPVNTDVLAVRSNDPI